MNGVFLIEMTILLVPKNMVLVVKMVRCCSGPLGFKKTGASAYNWQTDMPVELKRRLM
jgi:hypothetical protein